MKRFVVFLFALFFLVTFTSLLFADDATKVKVNGTIQSWFSYAQTNTDTSQVGFGLRRVRLRFKSDLGENIKGYVQFEANSPKLLDARIEYYFFPKLKVYLGRFIGAGMRGAGLTSHTSIDLVERPASALLWARKTVGSDYRDYGAEIIGKSANFTGKLFFHNGGGAKNIKPSQIKEATKQTAEIAVSAMGTFAPKTVVKGLEVGGYYGKGNKYFNDYSSYSAYAYYEPKPLRIKAEYISVVNKDAYITESAVKDLIFSGYYLFGAYRILENLEALARYEVVDLNTGLSGDEETIITIGASYALFPTKWKEAKITPAYVIRREAGNLINNNIFYMMFQIVF